MTLILALFNVYNTTRFVFLFSFYSALFFKGKKKVQLFVRVMMMTAAARSALLFCFVCAMFIPEATKN